MRGDKEHYALRPGDNIQQAYIEALQEVQAAVGKAVFPDEKLPPIAEELQGRKYPVYERLAEGSSYFDFLGKMQDAVSLLNEAGGKISFPDYVRAAIKAPGLFYKAPDTVCENVYGVVEHLSTYGISLDRYLKAALTQPTVLTLTPDTIIDNLHGTVALFAEHRLTMEQYTKAALGQAQLFYQSPDTIYNNVEALVWRLREHGLTMENYLPAALEQPSLFHQSPNTIARNISGVVERLAGEGLTMERYLSAALKQPRLFAMSPDTVEGHVRLMMDLFDQRGLGRKDKQSHPAIEYMLKKPATLNWADDNYALRQIASALVPDLPRKAPIYKTRSSLEALLVEAIETHPEGFSQLTGFEIGKTEADDRMFTQRETARAFLQAMEGSVLKGPQR